MPQLSSKLTFPANPALKLLDAINANRVGGLPIHCPDATTLEAWRVQEAQNVTDGLAIWPTGQWVIVATDPAGTVRVWNGVSAFATQTMGGGGSGGTVALAAGTGAAAANRSALQAALDAGGHIETPAGTFYIDNVLLAGLYDGTPTRWAGRQTRLKLVPGAGTSILHSRSHAAVWDSITLTYATGTTVSVAKTAHGLTVGDYYTLDQWLPSEFNGTFRVLSVTDANTFVLQLRALPRSAPAGEPRTGPGRGKRAARHVDISGVLFDASYPDSNPTSQTLSTMAIIAGCVYDWAIRDYASLATEKYGILAYHCTHTHFDRGHMDTDSDGVHLFGAAFDCSVRGINGDTGDDLVAVSNRDINWPPLPSAGGQYVDIAGGDVDNVEIAMIGGQAGTTMAQVQVYSKNPYRTRNLKISGVAGKGAIGVRLFGDIDYGGRVESIVLEDVSACGIGISVQGQGGSLCVETMRVEGLKHNPDDGTDTALSTDSYAMIRDLHINGLTMPRGAGWGATGAPVVVSAHAHRAWIEGDFQLNTTGVAANVPPIVYAAPVGTNALTMTPSPALGSYAAGTVIALEPSNNNTAAATVNVSGLGAVPLRKEDGSTEFAANELSAFSRYYFSYDATKAVFRLLDTVGRGKRQLTLSGALSGGTSATGILLPAANSDGAEVICEKIHTGFRLNQLVSVQCPAKITLRDVQASNAGFNSGAIVVYGANAPALDVGLERCSIPSGRTVNLTVAATATISGWGNTLASNWLAVGANTSPTINLRTLDPGMGLNLLADLDSGAGTVVPAVTVGNMAYHTGSNPGPAAGNGTAWKSIINGGTDPA